MSSGGRASPALPASSSCASATQHGGGLVEMSANRPFGPFTGRRGGCRRWRSAHRAAIRAPAIRFRHVRGITTGMDVEWSFAPSPGGTHVGFFMSGTDRAGRDWCVCRQHRSSARYSFTESRRAPLPDWRTLPNVRLSTSPSRPGAIVVTSSRRHHRNRRGDADRHRRRRPSGSGLRRSGRRSGEVTRFDASIFRSQIAAEIDDFVPPTFSSQKQAEAPRPLRALHAARASRLAIEDAELELEPEDRERVGAMMGSALGGVALRRGAVRVFLTRGAQEVSTRAGDQRVRRRGELQHRDRVRRAGPEQHERDELRVGHDGRSATRSRQIRDGYADVMFCGRRGGAAQPAVLRRVRDHPRDVDAQRRSADGVAPVRQGSRRLRDGRGRGGAGARGVRAREVARRAHLRRGRRLRRSERRAPHDGAAPRRLAGRARRCGSRSGTPTSRPADIGYINAHGSSTPLNDPTETRAIRPSSASTPTKLQVSSTKALLRPRARRVGRDRAAIARWRSTSEWLPPTLNLDAPADGLRPGLHPERGPRRRRGVRAEQLLRLRRDQRGAGAEAARRGLTRGDARDG